MVILTDMFRRHPLQPRHFGDAEPRGRSDRRAKNLPMLVKLARVGADVPIKQAVKEAAEAGRKYINVASEALGG